MLAIELTLSVRSFHTPVTSRTWACPPSLPSVPTSRATRVTSEVKMLSCLIIVLTMVADRRNSPCSGRPSTSRRTVCKRSPWATAVIARVTSVVGHSRSSMSELTELSISPQAPLARSNLTRRRVLPSLPTTCPTRSSCFAIRSLAAMIKLKVSAIFPMMPVWSPGNRTEKSPRCMACRAWASCCNPIGLPQPGRADGDWSSLRGWAMTFSSGGMRVLSGGLTEPKGWATEPESAGHQAIGRLTPPRANVEQGAESGRQSPGRVRERKVTAVCSIASPVMGLTAGHSANHAK